MNYFTLLSFIFRLGWLYDALESYDPGFFTAGGMITISGLILFFIPTVQQRIQRNLNAKNTKNVMNHLPV